MKRATDRLLTGRPELGDLNRPSDRLKRKISSEQSNDRSWPKLAFRTSANGTSGELPVLADSASWNISNAEALERQRETHCGLSQPPEADVGFGEPGAGKPLSLEQPIRFELAPPFNRGCFEQIAMPGGRYG